MLPLLSSSLIASVIVLSLITAAMHGVNLLLISRVPLYYAKYGKISTVSGVLNAFTYIGSAASTYGVAVFSEKYGWYFTVGSWAVITLIGCLVCLINIRKWKKFTA
jgi:OPA family glycerol-3-phosphate transporter-like MFS transporter